MSRSTMRTVTETSGRPRRRTLRTLITGVLAAGSLAALAAPAQAYGGATCVQELGGTGNVFDVDPVRINTKRVDFGDLPHSFAGGGAPQADAVVCWGRDKVVIVGRLFYDAPLSGSDASVTLRGFTGAVAGHEWGGLWTTAGSPGAVTNREVREVWLPESGRMADRVHIQLALRTQSGESSTVVHDSDHVRGD